MFMNTYIIVDIIMKKDIEMNQYTVLIKKRDSNIFFVVYKIFLMVNIFDT